MRAEPVFDLESRPLAAKGLTSYRYPSEYSGFIMIGATSDEDALVQANRSLDVPTAVRAKLQVWSVEMMSYVAVGDESRTG